MPEVKVDAEMKAFAADVRATTPMCWPLFALPARVGRRA
jgi:hypothetical protein